MAEKNKLLVRLGNLRPKPRRKNKYGNKRFSIGNEKYNSIKERRRHLYHLSDPEVLEIKREVPFVFSINGKKMFTYLLDFMVIYKSGNVIYEDVKGGVATITPLFKLKKKIIEEVYQIKITIV